MSTTLVVLSQSSRNIIERWYSSCLDSDGDPHLLCTLPDARSIALREEMRILVPELLSDPNLYGYEPRVITSFTVCHTDIVRLSLVRELATRTTPPAYADLLADCGAVGVRNTTVARAFLKAYSSQYTECCVCLVTYIRLCALWDTFRTQIPCLQVEQT